MVAYTYIAHREYEERETLTSAGKSTTHVKQRSEQIEQRKHRVPFTMRDERGLVQVLPAEAKFELTETGNRFVETPQPWPGATYALGQRESERGLEVGARVFVIYTAIDHGGSVAIAGHLRTANKSFSSAARANKS